MNSNLLRIQQDGRLLRLTLARPSKRNALNLELSKALAEAVAAADPSDIGCILLDAEGPSFCAGMDLGEAGDVDPSELSAAHERLFSMNRWVQVPIVAAVQGHALAGGTGLLAQAHIVIAAPDAKFGLTEVRIGMWPLLVYRSIEAAIGERRTLEWSLTGRTIDAIEAHAAGLVHQLNPVEKALEIAREIAGRSADAVRIGMQYYRESRGQTFAAAGELAARLRGELMRSSDFHQSTQPFKSSK